MSDEEKKEESLVFKEASGAKKDTVGKSVKRTFNFTSALNVAASKINADVKEVNKNE